MADQSPGAGRSIARAFHPPATPAFGPGVIAWPVVAPRCGSIRVDPERRVLVDPVRGMLELRPKAFDVLCHLLSRIGELVTRDELLDAVWGEVHVTDDSVTQCIVEIRRALGEEAGVVVRTVPRRGYILEAETAPPPRAEEVELAVLPFREAGGGVAGGIGAEIAENLAVELARLGGVRVVAEAWLPGRGDRRRAGGRSAARHLLCGSIWLEEGRARLLAQLFDSRSALLLWAERYDHALAQRMALDGIVGRIARGAVQALAAASSGAIAPAPGPDRVVQLPSRR